jgi:hypothetical protein
MAADVVDAIVVATAVRHQAPVVTSDPGDLAHIAESIGVKIQLPDVTNSPELANGPAKGAWLAARWRRAGGHPQGRDHPVPGDARQFASARYCECGRLAGGHICGIFGGGRRSRAVGRLSSLQGGLNGVE